MHRIILQRALLRLAISSSIEQGGGGKSRMGRNTSVPTLNLRMSCLWKQYLERELILQSRKRLIPKQTSFASEMKSVICETPSSEYMSHELHDFLGAFHFFAGTPVPICQESNTS
ncbi:hypothetical protein JTE90_021261 [Oedothorax gibbosus]|uniref:Uncharacterized protein n=1 Tax=Oedothorax gibbosus TaxID=931172 RepID=A0AAV6U0E2_9ARAC|nr:hypothetical protein JTE90_021261 [Oedothorax gibbosus]